MAQAQSQPMTSSPPSPGRLDPGVLGGWFERMTQGDEAAFDALFGALYEPLRQFARSYVRSADVAEEIVEDLFLKLWADRDRLRVRGSVAGYLYVSVRHRALNHLKRTRTERLHLDALRRDERWVATHGVNEAEERLRDAELTESVQKAIDRLPPRARETYQLYYQHHLSYAEIANVMGTSVKTVENQLSRSLKSLWSQLKDVFE